ncbi:MAG: transglycosylase SLT domain-containing protein [Pseudomonadota bacterium]|nr:transglycosylase SLT domain-containing protein [Pseudomonadota bacterium]
MKSNRLPDIGTVYGGGPWRPLLLVVLALAMWLPPAPVARAQGAEQVIVDARDALRRKDRVRLLALRDLAVQTHSPLAMWPDYWELSNRIGEVQQPEVDQFVARWPGTYVEDRLRNDWLLELGKRRDWEHFALEYPRFRMNDDREVTCYALWLDQQAGKDVAAAARAAWLAQRDADDGCAAMAAGLYDAGVFKAADAWFKARRAVDAGRLRTARQAAALVGPETGAAMAELMDNPARYLARSAAASSRNGAELSTLALMRVAAADPDAAATQLTDRWDRLLPPDLSAWAWASAAKQAALKLQPEAPDYFRRATERQSKAGREIDWSDDMLAWQARAALRADNGKARWKQVLQAIEAMNEPAQRDPAWVYWKARALLAIAPGSDNADGLRGAARDQLGSIARELSFYGTLAAETLGQPVFQPPRPLPPTAEEQAAVLNQPGFGRALRLIEIGLRSEGVREWNYSIRGMGDRELLAAAQLACDHQVWDRCINTSDRTQAEIDLTQRFPTPLRREVVAQASGIGLDPAYVYGLIRQESRFVMDARSSVGASGLMQIMPATARWTAKRIGLDFSNEELTDRDTNLKIGTRYLKLVLDDFGGSQALAAAAYNAGPGRPRRWREGPVLEPAIWAENVPIAETRDYVKKVLSNATYYAAQLGMTAPSLTQRLGRPIAPAGQDNPLDRELP